MSKMIVAGVLLVFLMPSLQAKCLTNCNSQIFTCSVTRVRRRECGEVKTASVNETGAVRIKTHRGQTEISWQKPEEFDGLMSLRGGRRCYRVVITRSEVDGDEGRVGVRCSGGVRPLQLYDVKGSTPHRIAKWGRTPRNLSVSAGRHRCVTPRRVKASSPGGGGLTVMCWDYTGSSNLSVSILTHPDHAHITSRILDVTSLVGQHKMGRVHFEDFSPPRGRYVAVVGPVDCPASRRESATFQWPPVTETTTLTPSRRYRHTCTCWVPDIVSVRGLNESAGEVEVEWSGNYSDSDVKVGVVRTGENSVFTSHITLTAPQLMRLKKNSVSLPLSSNTSGEFYALVGSIGCASCMRYRESEDFYWPPPPPPSSEAPSSSTDSSRWDNSYPTDSLTAALIAIGVFAFIIVVALGVIISRKCWGVLPKLRGVTEVIRDDTQETLLPVHPRLETVRTVHVVFSPNTEEFQHAAGRLEERLQQLGITTTLKELEEEVGQDAEIIMYLTWARETRRVPDQLKTHRARVVTVGVSLAADSHSPSVSIPPNFHFSDVPNNLTTLEDFLKQFRDPRTVKVLLVSSGEDEGQLKACRLLISLIDQPPLRLVFPDQQEHRTALRENASEWVDRQVQEARFILAVASAEMGSDEWFSNLTRVSNMVLDKARDSETVKKKIVLVSLGNCSNQVTAVQRPYLSTCQRFNPLSDGDEESLVSPLVNHLCGETDILQQACCRSDAERICGQDDMELRDQLQTLCSGEAEETV